MLGLKSSRESREFWASRGVTYTNREWRTIRLKSYRIEIVTRLQDAWDGLKGDR